MQLMSALIIIEMHIHKWAGLLLRLSYFLLANAEENDGKCEMDKDGRQ